MTADPSAPQVALATFLTRFDAFCALTSQEEGPVSNALFGASDRIAEIRNTASDVGTKRLAKADRALERLAESAGVSLPTSVDNAESEASADRPRAAGAPG